MPEPIPTNSKGFGPCSTPTITVFKKKIVLTILCERTDDPYEIRRNGIMEMNMKLFLMKTLIIFASAKFVSLFGV